MAIAYNSKPPSGMCFCFDALNTKCYSGSGNNFTELVSGYTTTRAGTNTIAIDSTLGKPHLKFVPGATTRTAYIPFPVDLYNPANGVRVPYGSVGTWNWWGYFQDQGNIEHVNIGWETGGSWDGANGFVFGTGYSTDGPRWGIAGSSYNYTNMSSSAHYATNTWQNYCVVFDGNAGYVKTYLNGEEVNSLSVGNKVISTVNTNDLFIGATNSRGGNWGGYMDIVQMWTRPLAPAEVKSLYRMYAGRF